MSSLIVGELEVIKNFIHPKDVVFDVGTCVGEWSEAVLNKYESVIIHQFEPILTSYELLAKKYMRQVENKMIFQNNLALSDKEGEVEFYYYPSHPVLSTEFRRNAIIEGRKNLKPKKCIVALTTLDSYCKEKGVKSINFLKIDTEGGELNVLKGAERLLAKRLIDCMQFEYGGCFLDSKTTLKQIWNLLASCGYKIFKLVSGGVEPILRWEDSLENYEYSNYLANWRENEED